MALSRVDRRPQPFVRTDLTQVAQGVLSTLELQLKSMAGKVEVDALPEIEADPVQMHQLLQNLIGNALKFHRQNAAPHVRVYAGESTPTGVQIVVADRCFTLSKKN